MVKGGSLSVERVIGKRASCHQRDEREGGCILISAFRMLDARRCVRRRERCFRLIVSASVAMHGRALLPENVVVCDRDSKRRVVR